MILQKKLTALKVDANTSKGIWKTEKFLLPDVIHSINLVNGLLVAQFVSAINHQTYIHTGKIENWIRNYKFRGNAGIKVFDPATGELIWNELNREINLISFHTFFSQCELIKISNQKFQIQNQFPNHRNLYDSTFVEQLMLSETELEFGILILEFEHFISLLSLLCF